jgi:hypothetical protein
LLMSISHSCLGEPVNNSPGAAIIQLITFYQQDITQIYSIEAVIMKVAGIAVSQV